MNHLKYNDYGSPDEKLIYRQVYQFPELAKEGEIFTVDSWDFTKNKRKETEIKIKTHKEKFFRDIVTGSIQDDNGTRYFSSKKLKPKVFIVICLLCAITGIILWVVSKTVTLDTSTETALSWIGGILFVTSFNVVPFIITGIMSSIKISETPFESKPAWA